MKKHIANKELTKRLYKLNKDRNTISHNLMLVDSAFSKDLKDAFELAKYCMVVRDLALLRK